jgi:glycosyltransferase involved in cell wall biosynthesis
MDKDINGVSIVVAAYKVQNYIEECLDSINNQTWFNNNEYEILLGIDNCDFTLNIINKIKDKYKNLKIWWFEDNVGPYVVFNTLIHKSKYDVISIFGADDIMMIDFIESNINLLKPKTIIKSQCRNFMNNQNPINSDGRIYNPNGVVTFYKIDFFKVNGFANWRCGADSDFIKRFSLNGIKSINSNSITYYRRIHKESLTNNNKYGMNSQYRTKIKKLIKNRIATKKIKNDKYMIFNNVRQLNINI